MMDHDERSPLLRHEGRTPSQISEATQLSITQEAFRLLRSTIPITASFALQNIVQAVSVIIVGSLGHHELDIASYGYMFATCTGSMVAIGGATALDTLCAHAVAVAGKTTESPTLLGRHLQQSLIVLSTLFILVITPVWIFSDRLFLALGQEAWLARGTHRFLVLMLPAGYFQMLAECLKKYGQVQGQSTAVGWATFAATIVGVVSNQIFVKATPLRINGAPCAFFIYQLTTVAILCVLLVRRERQTKTIVFLRTWESLLDGLWVNAFLSLTGLTTIATEWWR